MTRSTRLLIVLAVIAGIAMAAMPAVAVLPTSGLVGYYKADGLSGNVSSWPNSSGQPGAWIALPCVNAASAPVLAGETPLGGNAVDLTTGDRMFGAIFTGWQNHGVFSTYSGMTILVVVKPTDSSFYGPFAGTGGEHNITLYSNYDALRYLTPNSYVLSDHTVLGKWTILAADMVNNSATASTINLYQTDYVTTGRPSTVSWSTAAAAGNTIWGGSGYDMFGVGGNWVWYGGYGGAAKSKLVATLVYNRVLSASERGDAIKALYTQYYGTWPAAWTVTGQVKDSGGNGISGATVAIVGGSSTTTDGSGNYVLTPAESAGSYTLRASTSPVDGHGGPAYRPSDFSITIDGSAGTTHNFTLSDAWKVQGQVKRSADSVALSGATVAVVGGSSSTLTDASGNYFLYATEAAGSYTLRASMPIGYWPVDFGVTIDGTSGITHDFAMAYKWRAQGSVQNADGRKLIGATVSVVGGTSSTTTDSAGNYYLLTSEVPGSYSLKASLAPFVDASVPITIDPSPSSLFTYNFTLPHAAGIHGTVTASNLPGNLPIAGAKVVASGGNTYEVYSDAFGYYYIPAVADTYDMEADKTSYDPYIVSGITVANASSVVAQNFPMSHGGLWDLGIDFSTATSQNGQWSYGYIQTTAAAPDRAFTLYSACYDGSQYSQYYKTGVPMWGTPYQVWIPTPKWGSLGKNFGTTASDNTTGFTAYIEPGDTYWSCYMEGYQGTDQPCIRWTSPDERIVKIYYSIKGQDPAGGTYPVQLCNQGVKMLTKTASGFKGRATVGYTDSIGPVAIPTFQTIIPVTTGQRIDFLAGADDWTHGITGSVALTATITTVPASAAATCHSIAEIKSQPDGKIVFMVTPIKLASATQNGFMKYGDPTSTAKSFYVQSDDRQQGLKLMNDESTPTYAVGWKITFSGTVATVDGQKVVMVSSINSATSDTAPAPLGKVSKGLTASNTLVKVWGTIKQMAPNTGPDSSQWNYEYMIINDGGQDIKIPMHVQYTWMSTIDPPVASLSVGDYVAVTGIATTTDGNNVVVMPRGMGGGYNDIMTYLDVP